MKIMLIILLIFGGMSFSSILVQAEQIQDPSLMKIVENFKPSKAILIKADRPSSAKPIQFYDFNHDGQKEIIITYEIEAKEQHSPSQFEVMILKKEKDENWRKLFDDQFQGVDLDFSGLADITGNVVKEYLWGVTIGAAAGSQLKVIHWDGISFKEIATEPYHKIDLVKGNQKLGISAWHLYIGDSYLVDVLKWNGEKLVYDQELHSTYYPIIKKFYKNKIRKFDAWYYWYCLADAQIQTNLFDEASKSIKKGKLLAKKLSMPEVVQDFNNLSKRLENKKNTGEPSDK
ncbi:hypothetical protein COK01_21720 [Priestia megaterium]|uniref:hypothetical protein n=1 Tax=Priestia megaterium TaxID=1404 RepID=UPI000BF83570|nr:hypothetical protein [Priestia megaterium]PFP46241.1 hypothetical protein COK01_21720 [Priestia megaterium]